MWPQEYIELKQIEDLLVCGICYELLDTSLVTLCSHNYCSLCIRKYLHYKQQCPICFAEALEKDLRKNKVLDEIISKFSQIKDKLKKCLKISLVQVNKNNDVYKTPKSVRLDKNLKEDKCERTITNSTPVCERDALKSLNIQNEVCSPSTSSSARIPLMFTPKSTKRPAVVHTEDTKVVVCPVCKVGVSEIHINKHLDDCLKRESQAKVSTEVEPKRKPLPKLVFSLMKEAMLKKKLKEFGLSSQGNRKALETRLQKYIIIYNAECDKLNPRPISDLVKQCEEEETFEKSSIKASHVNKLQVTKNTDENIIEGERKKYLHANKDSFETLIKKIKDAGSSKQPLIGKKENNTNVEEKCETLCKVSESAISVSTQCEPARSIVYIPDSDSEASCPLQIYSSSDPKKFLNIDFSSSDSQNTSRCEEHLEEHIDIKSSLIRVDEMEDDNSSDILNNLIQSDNIFSQDTPKSHCKTLSSTPRYKTTSQKKDALFQNQRNIGWDSVNAIIKVTDDNSRSTCDDEDFTSNNDIDTKFNLDSLRSINSDSLNNENQEKENISRSSEFSGNRPRRKRSHDSLQNDNRTNTMRTSKKNKRSTNYFAIETKESIEDEPLSVSKEKGMDRSQNRPQIRKLLGDIVEDTTVVRKSSRIKRKNNNS